MKQIIGDRCENQDSLTPQWYVVYSDGSEQRMASQGCVEYGNNNFYELMLVEDGSLLFGPHDDHSVYLTTKEFFNEVPSDSVQEILQDMNEEFLRKLITELVTS